MTLNDCWSQAQPGVAVSDAAAMNSSERSNTPHLATLDPLASDFVPSHSPPSDPPTSEPFENPYLASYWAALFAREQLESGFAADAYMTLLRASPFASQPAKPTQVSKLVASVGKIRFQLNTGRAEELWNALEGRMRGQVRGVPWEGKVFRMKALEGLEDYHRLLEYLNELIEDNPDEPPVASLLDRISLVSTLKKEGNDAFNASRLGDAIGKYTQGLGVDPDNNAIRAVLFTNRGIAYSKRNCALRQLGLEGEEREAIERERDKFAREKMAQEQTEREERDERRSREQEGKDERRRREKAARETNHYTVLGIAFGATQAQIRIAYRKRALETHPDKGGCEEKFKKVQAVYEALCSKRKKNGGGSEDGGRKSYLRSYPNRYDTDEDDSSDEYDSDDDEYDSGDF